ncbi:MAG: hypothetical protein MI743_01425 [Sneathiellales bacterium]|nr:hypothetical protein [Sneathiellales bacterium]
MDLSQVTPEFWASLANMVIFLSLIAIPWVVGTVRPLIFFLGGGGILALLGFDFWVGIETRDYDLAADLMILTASKAAFFFLISYALEKIVRTFFKKSKEENAGKQLQQEEIKTRFDRNFRGVKDPEERP